MRRLTNDLIHSLYDMCVEAESTHPIGALETSRETLILSNKLWLFEWPEELVASDVNLRKLLQDAGQIFKRADEFFNTPWSKLLFPNKKLYVSCDQDGPTDEEQIHNMAAFITGEDERYLFDASYVSMFETLCEDVYYEIYAEPGGIAALVAYEDGKRVGVTLQCQDL